MWQLRLWEQFSWCLCPHVLVMLLCLKLKQLLFQLYRKTLRQCGLNSNMMRVWLEMQNLFLIKSKSNYRQGKQQYPEKKGVIDGTRAVFNALRQAGIIVLFKDSPVIIHINPLCNFGSSTKCTSPWWRIAFAWQTYPTLEAENGFVDLNLALQTTPSLGLPDPTRLSTQSVDEKNGCKTSNNCSKTLWC